MDRIAMPLISSFDAPTFTLDQLTVVGLASPSRHAAQTSVWRLSLAPGAEGAEHSVDREEIFVALAGSAEFVLDGSVVRVGQGDALVVPASTPIRVCVRGAEAFEAVCVLPIGAKASMPGGEPFVPPWAE
jgi:quercetin dioxygenase-like cupin family protein